MEHSVQFLTAGMREYRSSSWPIKNKYFTWLWGRCTVKKSFPIAQGTVEAHVPYSYFPHLKSFIVKPWSTSKTCGWLAGFSPDPKPADLQWLALPIQKNLKPGQSSVLSAGDILMTPLCLYFQIKHSTWVNATHLAKTPILHILEPPTQRACCKNPPPQQRSNDTLWIYVCPLIFQHLLPQSTSVKGFAKPNISKTTDSNEMALYQQITRAMNSYSTHQSRQTAGCIWCFDTSWAAKCHCQSLCSQEQIFTRQVQIILRAGLNDNSLPFQALLSEHRWLALCLKPALPGTGTSASSWLCTLLHSDDFFQVLPSSLFWLVYDLVCLVSLPCLQPPGKEGQNKDPVCKGNAGTMWL